MSDYSIIHDVNPILYTLEIAEEETLRYFYSYAHTMRLLLYPYAFSPIPYNDGGFIFVEWKERGIIIQFSCYAPLLRAIAGRNV